VDYELYLRSMMMALFPSGPDPDTVRAFLEINRKAATLEMQEAMAKARRLLARLDYAALVAQIRAPTLVLHRRGDQAAPFESGRQTASRIAGARFVPLEGDAHFPWVDDWRSVAEPMVEFLCENEERAAANNVALTGRQLDVLRLIACGKSNSEIARELFISNNTVARHVSNILTRTGSSNRTEAGVYAYREGLV
jgi:DNA-binding CsgD family transcriptional regulator